MIIVATVLQKDPSLFNLLMYIYYHLYIILYNYVYLQIVILNIIGPTICNPILFVFLIRRTKFKVFFDVVYLFSAIIIN